MLVDILKYPSCEQFEFEVIYNLLYLPFPIFSLIQLFIIIIIIIRMHELSCV
jgi:hypothetical protein